MAYIGRFGKCLAIYGIFLLIPVSRCQLPVHHPSQQVNFHQTSADWRNPQLQQRNPQWKEFPAPMKRSPEFVQPNYNSNQPYSYNTGPFGPRPVQHFQNNHNFQNYNDRSFVIGVENQNFNNHQNHPGRSPFSGAETQNFNNFQNYDGTSPMTAAENQNFNNFQNYDGRSSPVPNDGRLLSESAFTKISETLGAINTVGHYLVDMVNDEHENEDEDPNLKHLPQAFYTISKNVLGRNVTDKIAPYVRKALPKVLPDAPITKIATANDRNDVKSCTTPEGQEGVCEDLSNCPQLLLNLVNLRESLCFKDLFVPGVCCPKDAVVTTPVPERPVVATTSKPTYLVPVTQKPKPQTTKRPSAVLVLTTKRPKQTPRPVTSTAKPTTPASTTVTTPRPIRTTTFYYSTVAPPVLSNFTNIVDVDECGQHEDEGGRIVGGIAPIMGYWPWMAAIFLHGKKRKEFWCGGTLVGTRHVLTAAHCTRDSKQRPFPPRQFSVRLGDVDLESDDEPSQPVTFRVTAVRAHEKFSRVGFYNDIAILVLSENVQKSKYVIPICLPKGSQRYRTFEQEMATVVGWGATRYGASENPKLLQAELPVWRNEDCDSKYFQPITDTFLCAGYSVGGVDACQGDSGGPLMLKMNGRWTQIGVVSFGNKCGEPDYPGVYTRVTRYDYWLRQNIR